MGGVLTNWLFLCGLLCVIGARVSSRVLWLGCLCVVCVWVFLIGSLGWCSRCVVCWCRVGVGGRGFVGVTGCM